MDCRYSTSSWIYDSIINSGLLYIINKQNQTIDWTKCDTNASHSISQVCTDYMDYLIDIDDLAVKYSRCKNTIEKYLRIGNKNGWCNYYPVKYNSFIVLVSYMSEPLFYALSISSVVKILEKITNQKFNINNILDSFHNKYSYNGFTFMAPNSNDNKYIIRGIGAYETITQDSDLNRIKEIYQCICDKN